MKIFISTLMLALSLYIPLKAESATDNSALGFYMWLAQSQVMSSDGLKIDGHYISSSYASVDRIASSTPLLKFYADELDRQGVPIDFVILPLIESGNNPQARSPVNALGLWQFMPLTGREWGLGKSEVIDERVDVQKSTIAAARYLKSLYEHFHDWNLVLASYNWGPASVDKALKRGLRSPSGQINLSLLPTETRNYLLSFYTFNKLIRDNCKNLPLSQYPNRPYLIKIDPSNLEAHIKSTPSLSSTNEIVLKHMNGFDSDVRKKLPGTMLVPTQTFAQYFIPNKVSFKNGNSNSNKVTLSSCKGVRAEYRLSYGDTLQSVSRKFKMSVDKLIDLNPSVRFARPGVVLSLC